MNELMLLILILAAVTAAIGSYHLGYRQGAARTEQLVRDHRDAMNAKFNAMKLEAQEKLRQQREKAGHV